MQSALILLACALSANAYILGGYGGIGLGYGAGYGGLGLAGLGGYAGYGLGGT